jgi:hypothetical protein
MLNNRKYLKIISVENKEKLGAGSRWWLTPRQSGRLTIGLKITLTSLTRVVQCLWLALLRDPTE